MWHRAPTAWGPWQTACWRNGLRPVAARAGSRRRRPAPRRGRSEPPWSQRRLGELGLHAGQQLGPGLRELVDALTFEQSGDIGIGDTQTFQGVQHVRSVLILAGHPVSYTHLTLPTILRV